MLLWVQSMGLVLYFFHCYEDYKIISYDSFSTQIPITERLRFFSFCRLTVYSPCQNEF